MANYIKDLTTSFVDKAYICYTYQVKEDFDERDFYIMYILKVNGKAILFQHLSDLIRYFTGTMDEKELEKNTYDSFDDAYDALSEREL